MAPPPPVDVGRFSELSFSQDLLLVFAQMLLFYGRSRVIASLTRRPNLFLPVGCKFYSGSPLSDIGMAVAEGTTEELLATDKCDLCKPYRETRSRPLVRQDYFVASEGVKIFKQAAKLSLQYSKRLDAVQRNTGGLIGFFGPSGAGKTAAGLRYTLHMRANYNRFHDLQYLYLSFKNSWSQAAFTTYEERGLSVEQYALVLMDHVFRGLVLSSDAEQPSVNNPSAALLELGKHYAKAVAAISGSGCHPSVVLHIDEHTAVHKDPKTRRNFFDCLTNLSLKLREEGFCMFLIATSIGAPPPSHSHEEDGDGSSKSVSVPPSSKCGCQTGRAFLG